MRRITLLVFVVLAMAVMVAVTSNQNQTLAADYRCTTVSCPGLAQCSGDLFTWTGNCAISCYREQGAPGQIVQSGSANCSPPPAGGGGGGGGAGGGGGQEGGYCSMNWFWDTNCSGPDDIYEPWIF